MKSEPDRIDLLIVVLPLVLLGVLSFQVYRFVQMRHERTPGSQIAAEVSSLIARGPAPGSADSSGERAGAADPAAEGSGEAGTAPVEASGEALPEGTAPPVEAGAGEAPVADGEPDPGEEAPTTGSADGDGTGAPALPAGESGPPAGGDTGSSPIAAGDPGALPAAEPASSPLESAPSAAANPAGPSGSSASGAGVPVLLASGPDGDPPADPQQPADAAPQTDGGGGAAIPANPGQDVNPEKPAVVSAVPASNTVKVGEVVAVEIRIENGIDVGSVPFHLKFDPAVLMPNDSPSTVRGPFLSVPGHDTQFLATPGPGGDSIVVGLSIMGAAEGARGSGLLATIYLKAHAPGTSMVQITRASVRGADARKLPAMFNPTVIKVEP